MEKNTSESPTPSSRTDMISSTTIVFRHKKIFCARGSTAGVFVLCCLLPIPLPPTPIFDSSVNASYRNNIALSPSFPGHRINGFLFR